jgi:hypothetical protein
MLVVCVEELIMPTHAFYDVLHSFKDIHRIVLALAENLNDEQLNWKPEGYSTSIGFHLWHLARESDYLKAAILEYYPDLHLGMEKEGQIWAKENLAIKWGFPEGLHETVGTGLSEQVAASLPIPQKEERLSYLRCSYEAIEQFIELFDARYPTFDNIDEELHKKIEMVRLNLLVFLTHDCRHLGMMECLKGLQTPHASIPPFAKRAGQTGFGSATEKRK